MRPSPLPLLLVALAAVLTGGASAPSLPAATLAATAQGAGNAAGVVIADPDGGEPKTVCVRFAEDSISGKELLDRATERRPEIDPVYARFGSRGHAVCALCDQGCDASDCFCQSRYWNYNVARDGQWARSGVGVDQRVVEHGDVDGWAFGGDGAAPPYLSFETICGQATEPSSDASPGSPEPSAPAATSEPTAASETPSPEASLSAAPSPEASEPAAPSPEASTFAPTPSTDAAPSPPTSPTRTPATERAPTPAPEATDEGGAPLGGIGGALAFVVILGGLVGLALVRRR